MLGTEDLLGMKLVIDRSKQLSSNVKRCLVNHLDKELSTRDDAQAKIEIMIGTILDAIEDTSDIAERLLKDVAKYKAEGRRDIW